jgi:hypothetical protein
MTNPIARLGLSLLVAVGEGVGRLVWPSRRLCVRHSHGVYGARHWAHFNSYRAAPGWAFIEVGSWTVEVSWATRAGLSRLKITA